jgi:hypothetical protein
MTLEEFPDAFQFFGAYLYQDWDEIGDDWPEIVDVYLSETSSRVQRRLVDELATLIASPLSDEELGKLLEYLGNAFIQEGDLRTWLRAIRDRLLAHSAGKNPP